MCKRVIITKFFIIKQINSMLSITSCKIDAIGVRVTQSTPFASEQKQNRTIITNLIIVLIELNQKFIIPVALFLIFRSLIRAL